MEECLEPIITGRLLAGYLIHPHLSLYMTAPPLFQPLSLHTSHTHVLLHHRTLSILPLPYLPLFHSPALEIKH